MPTTRTECRQKGEEDEEEDYAGGLKPVFSAGNSAGSIAEPQLPGSTLLYSTQSHRNQKLKVHSEKPRPPQCSVPFLHPTCCVAVGGGGRRQGSVSISAASIWWGCLLCVQCLLFVLLPLIAAFGLALTLLFAKEAPLVHATLPGTTDVPTEEILADYPVSDAPSKTTTRPTGHPRAEMVIGCKDCDPRWPLSGRLVWRTAPGQRSSTGGGGNDESVFWDFPDIAMDLHGTWTLCPRLYVLVPTAPERRAQRKAIRATWGRLYQYPSCTLRVVFFLRLPHGREELAAIKAATGFPKMEEVVIHIRMTVRELYCSLVLS
ncbi:hypothetical protein HPB52_010795 [Rhipicephalus sanguineus]|uniref:Hexosyltransferase n=1 Tax=Rhipicephalus sanguineus TaxID=34632 RepID=A0A9D4T3H4_RHISA|nr:hypothetical protein HPB52_010795 [Rhipicephalus sanguineus]